MALVVVSGLKILTAHYELQKAVRTGRMWVNTYHELPAHAPFGGYKKSGLGRETHKMMLDAYSQVKTSSLVPKNN